MFSIQIKNAICTIEYPSLLDNNGKPDNQSIIDEVCKLIAREYVKSEEDSFPPKWEE